MVKTFQLANGLTVIIEEMDHVESVSFDLAVPGGLIIDTPDRIGASLIFAELLERGAGEYDSRGLSEAFERRGIRHGQGAGQDRFSLSCSLVGDDLQEALRLVSCMVRNPHLHQEEIPNIQSVMLQDLAALRDNPARRASVELTKRYYPVPFNRSSLGDAEGISATDRDTVRGIHEKYFTPRGAVLSIAGKVNSERALLWIEEYLGGWSGDAVDLPTFGALQPHEYTHVEFDSAQMQIVMALPSVKFGEEHYYDGKIAISLLGASMFGRLFIELREKKGLCYSVYARHGSTTSYGTVSAYCGTTPERAQESLDMLIGEFARLHGTVAHEELERAKTDLKAALLMGEESPASRASSNASDWWLIKRIRSLDEIRQGIDRVSVESVNRFLEQYPFKPCSVLTLGRHPLVVPHDLISSLAG
jgi:predicted Zn-dependent peptidase